jgi:hypothetical protein
MAVIRQINRVRQVEAASVFERFAQEAASITGVASPLDGGMVTD